MIFDTHAHYDDRKFNSDRDELLASLRANGIGRVVNIGADIESTRRAIALADKYDLCMQLPVFIQVTWIVWMNAAFSG